jgi:hypothetical protein
MSPAQGGRWIDGVLGDDGGGYVRKCARILLPGAAQRTTTVRINKIRELSHNVIIVVVLRVAKVERERATAC